MTRTSRTTKARRRIAYRLAQAERTVREAAAFVPDAVPAADAERDVGDCSHV